MPMRNLRAYAAALLWALCAGCLPGLGPCRAASGAVPPEVAGGLDPARLALGGDFTIRYTILDRDIRRRAAEDSKKSPDMTGRPMTVTLSEHGGTFLCQRMTNQPDPAAALTGDKKWSDVVLFDGKQSFHHIFAPPPARGSVLENNFLWDGFDGAELSAMPVFCSRVAAFPLI